MKQTLERRILFFALLVLAVSACLTTFFHLGDTLPERLLGSLLILGAALLIGIFPLLALFRHHILLPVSRLRSVAQSIAEGHFEVAVPSSSARELDDLGSALKEMAFSLKMRDEAILDGYRELEEANLLLQRAYDEQELTSAELQRSQTMYLTLCENASDAIVISDHNNAIFLFNRKAEEFFGVRRDAVIGKDLLETVAITGGAAESRFNAFAELLTHGNYESELTHIRPSDGSKVIGWIRATVARDYQGSNWVQAIVRDITRERQIKENLERGARELERLHRMKNSFLGLASHELKTPLTAIIGYAELVTNEIAPIADEGVRSMLGHISDAADRLSAIVRDMVDVAMLDARHLPLEIEHIDINDIVISAVGEYKPFLFLRHQKIELALWDDLPLVQCDPVRLGQAVGNLLGNAIKFTPDEGRITIRSRPHPEGNGPPNAVELVILDTGIGISENDCHHIFEKFYEAGDIEEHFTGKYAFKGRGAGLGLTLAKGIVEMHGGKIWAESPGYDPQRCPGSAFHILLPLAGIVT